VYVAKFNFKPVKGHSDIPFSAVTSLREGEHYLVLGEIQNRGGRTAVVAEDGRIFWNLPLAWFEEVNES